MGGAPRVALTYGGGEGVGGGGLPMGFTREFEFLHPQQFALHHQADSQHVIWQALLCNGTPVCQDHFDLSSR